MSEEEQDDAMGRLGGPSKIAELQDRVTEMKVGLEESIRKLEEATARNRVHVGRRVYISGSGLCWYNEDGHMQSPPGQLRIEGLGYDWCIIRSDVADALYFAATPGRSIRSDLARGIYDD